MLDYIKNLWTGVKQWFNYSWSVFIARIEVLTGLLVGIFGAIDWTALTQLDWSDGIKNYNTLIVSAMFIIKGIVSELGRRAGTVTAENSQLVAENIAKKAKIKVAE